MSTPAMMAKANAITQMFEETMKDAVRNGARFVSYERNDDGSLERMSHHREMNEDASSFVSNSSE